MPTIDQIEQIGGDGKNCQAVVGFGPTTIDRSTRIQEKKCGPRPHCDLTLTLTTERPPRHHRCTAGRTVGPASTETDGVTAFGQRAAATAGHWPNCAAHAAAGFSTSGRWPAASGHLPGKTGAHPHERYLDGETTRLGTYWHRPDWDAARAHIVDLDTPQRRLGSVDRSRGRAPRPPHPRRPRLCRRGRPRGDHRSGSPAPSRSPPR